jgi:hypothetical protein
MYKDLNPQKALIFRITHRDNVAWILDHGLHCPRSPTHDPNYVQIGNPELIDKRFSHLVQHQVGGTLGDYVPFYFTPFSMMLLNIKTGYNGDADPFDIIWFDEKKKELVQAFLTRDDAKPFREALEDSDTLIDGFQSPLGLELLATVDWLLHKEAIHPTVTALREGLHRWPGGTDAGARKAKLFDDRLLDVALERLIPYQDRIGAARSR